MDEKYVEEEYGNDSRPVYNSGRPANYDNEDVFGHEEGHDVLIPNPIFSRLSSGFEIWVPVLTRVCSINRSNTRLCHGSSWPS